MLLVLCFVVPWALRVVVPWTDVVGSGFMFVRRSCVAPDQATDTQRGVCAPQQPEEVKQKRQKYIPQKTKSVSHPQGVSMCL